MEKMFQRWEDGFGVAPRLTDLFGSPEGVALMRRFRNAHEEADPGVLPFLMIFFVLPEREWHGSLPPAEWAEKRRRLKQAARILEESARKGIEGPSGQLRQIQVDIRRVAESLPRRENHVRVGCLAIYGKPSAPRRHRAKRQVVFFLTGYFTKLGRKTPPWAAITDFLVLAGLAKRGTRPSRIATWWSNILKREAGPANPIEPHQEGFLQLFEQVKKDIELARDTP